MSQGHGSGQGEKERGGERKRERVVVKGQRERGRRDEGSLVEGGRARERALAAPIYAPVTEPSGAIKLAL